MGGSARGGLLRRAAEIVAPRRMGVDFRWLMTSDWANQLGDGIALAAGPLLIASLTKNPALVALATLLQRAPWFLFGLYAGWIADRTNRRVMMAASDVARGVVLVGLVLVIGSGQATVPLVLGAMFLLGTAETFADSASGTLMPMMVAPADLGVANARMSFGRRALNELIGPPVGAALVVVGLAWPFAVQSILVMLAAVLISRITAGRPAEVPESAGIKADVGEGIRWLWANPPMRTLTLMVVLFNLTFGAMWPLLVLYADERLGLDEIGFGLLLSASAVGGLLGAMSFGWLEKRIALGTLMQVVLLYETFLHLFLAWSTTAWISMLLLFGFGFQTSMWGTTSTSIRQRAVPEQLQGRVGSVYMLGVFGGLVIGNAIGAVIAGIWGIIAVLYFAFIGDVLLLLYLWRELPKIAHADAQAQAAATL